MIRYFQTRFALSEKGAKDFRKGVVFSTLLNLAFMLPATYLFFFLMEYLGENSPAKHSFWFYVVLAGVLAGVMYFISLRQ